MKRYFAILLVIVIAAFTLSSCTSGGTASNPSAPATASSTPAGQTTRLLMVTGGTSGTYYAYGGVLANILSGKVADLEITANTSGASAANVRSLNNAEAELAIVQNDVLDYAYNGTEMLAADGAMPTLRTIATLYPEVIQVVATTQSGIKTIADLKGKRVCVGDAGSGTEANARQVLEAYGLSFDDIKVEHLSFGDAATAMQNGNLDASFTSAGVPNPAITELKSTVDIVLVPIDGAEAATLMEKYSYYSAYEIADDAYGVPGVSTVSILATLACTENLSEDLVYEITKALIESQPEIAAAHAKGAELSLESAVQGVSIPFHPGAEKYYQEKGLR